MASLNDLNSINSTKTYNLSSSIIEPSFLTYIYILRLLWRGTKQICNGHKFKFSHLFNLKSQTFGISNYVLGQIVKVSTPSGCKDIGIWKIGYVIIAHLLCILDKRISNNIWSIKKKERKNQRLKYNNKMTFSIS